MKRILFSCIIALGFHIGFFAAIPTMFLTEHNSFTPPAKSIDVIMSYRPYKMKQPEKKTRAFSPQKAEFKKAQTKRLSSIKTEKPVESEKKIEENVTYQQKHIEQKTSDHKISNPVNSESEINKMVNITEPCYKRKPLLEYPLIAKKRGYEGTVELMVQVSEHGNVSNLWIFKSSNYKSLDTQALKIVKKWIFEPGRINGNPEMMWVKIPVKFKLK